MTKNLFKWMMALALVATPVFFTACGDDDTSSSSDNQKTFIDFTVSESVGGEITVLSEIRSWGSDTLRSVLPQPSANICYYLICRTSTSNIQTSVYPFSVSLPSRL